VAARLEVVAPEPAKLLGEEPEVVRDPRHHAAAVGAQQRPVVGGLDDRQVLDPCLDPVRHALERPRAIVRRRRAPRLEGPPRGLDRAVDVLRRAARDPRDHRFVDRRDVVEDAAVGGCGPLPADPVLGRDLDPRHRRHPGRLQPACDTAARARTLPQTARSTPARPRPAGRSRRAANAGRCGAGGVSRRTP
jgi:hypothetical protein